LGPSALRGTAMPDIGGMLRTELIVMMFFT